MLDAMSFDHVDITTLAQFFNITSASGQPTIVSDSARGSTKALACNSFGYAAKTFPATATPRKKIAFKVQSLAVAQTILSYLDAGAAQVSIRYNTDGTLQFQRGGANIGSPSTFSILAGVWYHLDVPAEIADSGGALDAYINGDPTPALSFTGDTKATSNATVNSWRLGPVTGEGSNLIYFKDPVWCTAEEMGVGDARVLVDYGTSDEGTNDLTPSTGTDHYPLVNEVPPSASQKLTGTTGVELLGFDALTVHPAEFIALIIEDFGFKDDTGDRFRVGIAKRSGTEHAAPAGPQAYSTSQLCAHHVFLLDPATSAAWLEAGVNAGKYGLEVS